MGRPNLVLMYRQIYLLVACLLFSLSQAQITAYPYVEDFEDFTLVQTVGSCVTPGGMNANGWTQITTDDGDWRSDTAGTTSVSTGPGSTSTTSGVGIGTDVNPGTIGGHYLYTEASGCGNTEVGLLSPSFDFSGQDSFFRLKIHVHMFGDGIGSFHIDVFDDNQWYNDQYVQIGQIDSNWNQIILNMAQFNSDSVHLRIRGITGSNFRSDICIDNAQIETYDPPRYDAVLQEATHSNTDYPISPLSQVDSVWVSALVKNEGINQITGVKVNVSEGSYNSDISLGSIASFDTASGRVITAYSPSTVGLKNFQCIAEINESDSFAINDTAWTSLIVSDSVLARENSSSIAGVGFNGATGFLGQMFELNAEDTLSSISFFAGGASGDSAKVYLYEFDTLPGALVATSQSIVLSGTAQWYSIRLNCEKVLDAGKYFAVVEQKGTNNIGLSMEASGFRPNTVFYRGAGATTWTPIEVAGFEVCYLLRMNFGIVRTPDVMVNMASDTICQKNSLLVNASGASTFEWSPASAFGNYKSAVTFASLDSSQWITLIGSNQCGFKDSASRFITVKPGPHFEVSEDTTVCLRDSITLKVSTLNSYQWSGGPSNQDYQVQLFSDSSFAVRIDSSNGCYRTAQIDIEVSEVNVMVEGDTSVCEGEVVEFIASGAMSYQWRTGPSDSVYQLIAEESGYYVVSGFNALNCEDRDSVQLMVMDAPDLNLPEDTGACFTDSLYLIASGADSLYWEGQGSDSVLALRVIKIADYIAVAKNVNGCEQRDTVHVDVYIPPLAEVSEDTVICEGGIANLKASGGDIYQWSTQESQASINVSPSSDQTYYVEVISLNGCSDEDSVKVSVNPLPIASFDTAKWVDSIQLSNTSLYANMYKWYFGDGDSSNEVNPNHVYAEDGVYTIRLIAENDCGSREISLNVTIEIPIGQVEDLLLNTLNFYPNPSSDNVNLRMSNSLEGLVHLHLTDLYGKEVRSYKVDKTIRDWSYVVSVEGLSPGAYYLNIAIQHSSTMVKLIIE